jgi:membrane protein
MAKLWSLRGLSWGELTKRTCRSSWDDEIFGQSARMAFYFFFALFPVLLLLLIVLGKTVGGAPGWRDALLESFKQVLPPDASALMMRTIQQMSMGAVLGTGAILAGVYAAWAAMNGSWAMMTGLNKAYEVEENRPWWRVLYVMFGLTISLAFLSLSALATIVYGNRVGTILGHPLGAPAHFEFLWRTIPWAVIVILLLFSFAGFYRFGPNLKDRRWQWSIPGAVIAVTLWVPLTLLLRVYQEHFGSSRIYGGLNAVATLLLWLYLTGAVVFIGGEANSEIEKAAAEAGHPDVRDTGERRGGGNGSSDQ